METRANYALIGLFTLAVIAAGFAFVYWFHRAGGLAERETYQVVFDGPVSGLGTGAAVVFNGIRVGEVSTLSLDPNNPRQVVATIAISRNAPVRADTTVSVEYQGLTGIAALALRGGSADAPLPVRDDGRPPILKQEPGGRGDLMTSGRDVMQRLERILVENQEALHGTIQNLETFTAALAKNTDRIDRIVASAESAMSGVDEIINGKDGEPSDMREAIRSIKKLSDNLDTRTGQTLESFRDLAKGFDKRTDDVSGSIRKLAGDLDKRINTIGDNLERFTGKGLRNWERWPSDARRAVNTFEQAVRNFDRNPSRLIWGGAVARPPRNRRGTPPLRRRAAQR